MMDIDYKIELLNYLVNAYERSKTNIGLNKVNRKFSISISKIFSAYANESDYNSFREINDILLELEADNFVTLKIKSGEMYDTATLNIDLLEDIYLFLNRKPKNDIYADVKMLLEQFEYCNDILMKFCNELSLRVSENKSIPYISADGDLTELRNILIALKEIYLLETETFYRDFSIRIYADSKVFDGICKKVEKIICEYTENSDEETVLADLNLVKNPGHIYIKGNGIIEFGMQNLDLSKLAGNIAISSDMLKSVTKLNVNGARIITIENLTSFHSYPCNDDFVIYLGGYHNAVRREFIKKIYVDNNDKEFLHFGDIDAGGFYILEHLCNKTNVNFKPYLMNIEVLQKYSHYTKKLTENDKIRLNNLLNSRYHDVIKFMLDNNCKLEQEIVDALA